MNVDQFNQYTTEDFVLDKDFVNLVRNPNEEQNLKKLRDSLPEKRREINLAILIIKGLKTEKFTKSDAEISKSWHQIANKSRRKHVLFSYIKYAATVALLFATSITIYYVTTNNSDSNFTSSNQLLNNTLEKKSNEAILVLSNGQEVSIRTKESSLKFSADGSKIQVNDSKSIIQDINAIGANKLIVPYGKRSTITLSDGTKVWLNSGSTIVFPPAFKGTSREVQLIGEAFFDVTHNKEKPFFVKTDAFKMKVYGTKFDIQAYKQDNAYSVVLVEGKVSMKSNTDDFSKEVFLKPNQRATIIDGNSDFNINEVENIDVYTSWTEGYLTFSDEDVSHLLKQISRYYNVEIEINTTQSIDKICGKLDLKEDILKVLDGISFISKTKYKKVGSKYEFYQ